MEKETQNGKAAVLGLQHLLAMYAGAVAVPLLIGTGLGFNQEQMTYLISIDIFMCGLATLLQLTVNRLFGIGLPVVLGCAIQAVAPLILIGTNEGVGAIYGSIIASGIFVVLVSGVFSKIKKLFPPIVTGTVITVIGLTLIPVAIEKMGGGNATAADFGDKTNLLLAFVTILLIVGVQMLAKGFIRSIAVLIGLVGGSILAAFMGMIDLSAIGDAPLFHVPQPFYFGKPTFDVWSILLMIIISMVSMVESTGVYFALGDITGKNVGEEELKKGYRAEGLAVILGGIFTGAGTYTPGNAIIPRVVGLTKQEATVALENEGFEVEVIRANSDTVAKDVVMVQDPLEDSKLARGGTVTITVSLGKESSEVPMPDLKGLTGAEATTELDNLGLTLKIVGEEYNDKYPQGQIISQNYTVGSTISSGTEVEVRNQSGTGKGLL